MTSRKKKKAFIYLGGSYPQVEAIKSLKSLNLAIILVDQSGTAVCLPYADHFIECSVTDGKQILSQLKMLDAEYDYVGAYGVADYAYKTVAMIHEHYQINALKFLEFNKLHNKQTTKNHLNQAGILCPRNIWYGSESELPDLDILLENHINGSCVVKAIDQNNSRGVHILHRPTIASLKAAIENAFHYSPEILIEEYIEGQIGNVDILMLDGEPYPVSTTIRTNDPEIPQICTAMIQPACLWDQYEEKAFQLAQKVAKALDYKTGPLTIDLLITGKQEIYVLEASPHFHCIQTEILRGNGSPIAAYASFLKNPSGNFKNHLKTNHQQGAFCYQKFIHGNGVINNIHGLSKPEFKNNLLASYIFFKNGQTLTNNNQNKQILGLFWCKFSSTEEKDTLLSHLEKNIYVSYSSPLRNNDHTCAALLES